MCTRVKGSRTNQTEWNQVLRDAIQCLKDRRSKIWDKRSIPLLKPEERYLFVNETGYPLRKSSLDSAFNRFITIMAIDEGHITEEQRFGLLDLKRRGTTDTQGTRADKQEATGHRSQSMMDIYDHSIAVVKPVSE